MAKSMTLSGATVTNTGTGTATATVSSKLGNNVVLQSLITKTSGTLGGTVTLQVSSDGTNYVTAPTTLVEGAESTYTVTDSATQSFVFVVKGNPFAKYRLRWTGTGTMVGVITSASITVK